MKISLTKQYVFSKDVISFMEKTILPRLGVDELNDDNIDEVCESAAAIEIEFANRKDLSNEEKELFKIAMKTVTELSLYDN